MDWSEGKGSVGVAKHRIDTADSNTERHIAEVNWDGSVILRDPDAYFKGEGVRRRLEFLKVMHKRKDSLKRRKLAIIRARKTSASREAKLR